MTFLELCQRTAREGGVEGTVSSVTSQVGMNRKIIDWVTDAWTDLQTMRPWLFMCGEFNGSLVVGQQSYVIAAAVADGGFNVGNFKEFASDRLYATDVNGKYEIPLAEYGVFRTRTLGQDVYDQRPCFATIGPGYTLTLNARPDVVATVKADYWKKATVLAADDDVPAMNSDWHMAIVYKALRSYAEHEESPEIQRRARRMFLNIFNEMCITELPAFNIPARPLAWGRRDA